MKRIIASFIFTDHYAWFDKWALRFHILSDKTICVEYEKNQRVYFTIGEFELKFKTNLADLLTEHHVPIADIQWTTTS